MDMRYKTVQREVKNGISILSLNNPPVNQLSNHFVKEISDALQQSFTDQAVKAIIFTGTGKNFIAGADITEMRREKEKEVIVRKTRENHHFLNSIEQGPKPVISAINGNCFGAGLEFVMATHYRIAAKGVQLGQPEVKLGLIPGGGGTQRLPRLVGLSDALHMITLGDSISAEEGMKKGLLDEVVSTDKLMDRAFNVSDRFISGDLNHKDRMTRDKKDKRLSLKEKAEIITSAKEMAAKQAKGYIAPLKAIEAVERGVTDNFTADLELETGLFADCVVSDVAKYLIGIFLNTRAAGKLPRIENVGPKQIRKVGVLGGGVMGSKIVNVLISRRFDTILWDINDEALRKGLDAIHKSFAYPIKKGKITREELGQLLKEHLVTTIVLETMSDVDLVIEAVLEDMKIKQDLWERLEGVCRSDVLFGTNTSALPITEIASVLKVPDRMIGLHFFNPAERMQLLEIICGKRTSNQILSTSVAFGRVIGKIPVVVNDGPGFYVSRQLTALMGELPFMLAQGVDLSKVEEAVREFGFPMGPATLADLNGLDVTYHVGKTFEKSFGERWENNHLFERVYQTGCYGRKSGSGWFDYKGQEPVPNHKVQSVIKSYLTEKGVSPKTMTHKEIIDRMMARGINEAAYIIQEGICDRPQDMDLAMIYGVGFPRYRGGMLRYADAWGIANVYQYLLELESEHGVRFQPCSLLRKMAEEEKNFYQI